MPLLGIYLYTVLSGLGHHNLTNRSTNMLDTKRYFPKGVWFQTSAGWVSQPATKADTVRREQYLLDFAQRQEARHAQQG